MRLHAALAVVAGAFSVFSFAPFGQAWLLPLTLAALFALWQRARRVRDGAMLGFAWGFGAFAAGISWLYVALNRYGGMPPPLAALAIALFCAYLALFPALAGGLFVRLRRGHCLADSLLFAALWCLAEWLRGYLFTGFPWLAVGYSQTPPSPLAAYFALFGVYGVGALLAFCAALLAQVLRIWRGMRSVASSLPFKGRGGVGMGSGNARKPHPPPGLPLEGGGAEKQSPDENASSLRFHTVKVLAGIVALGVAVPVVGALFARQQWVMPHGEPLKVALLQTNIEQGLKWRPELLARWLDENRRAALSSDAALVVLPETTLPLLADRLPPGYLQSLAEPLAARGADLVLGIFTRNERAQIHNAAISLGASPSQHYAKRHLVPFGEYSPPLFGWFYRLASIPMSDQTPGAADQPPLQLQGQRIAVNICYEDLFGEELIRTLPEATLMLNLSNLAWYGDSFAQPQHLQIARARALETGRPMLRATNTGMTALVQPDGRVEAVLPAFTSGVLEVSVRGYQGSTPYARWGNFPILLLAALIVVLHLRRRR